MYLKERNGFLETYEDSKLDVTGVINVYKLV